jgi:hypothetical protein
MNNHCENLRNYSFGLYVQIVAVLITLWLNSAFRLNIINPGGSNRVICVEPRNNSSLLSTRPYMWNVKLSAHYLASYQSHSTPQSLTFNCVLLPETFVYLLLLIMLFDKFRLRIWSRTYFSIGHEADHSLLYIAGIRIKGGVAPLPLRLRGLCVDNFCLLWYDVSNRFTTHVPSNSKYLI